MITTTEINYRPRGRVKKKEKRRGRRLNKTLYKGSERLKKGILLAIKVQKYSALQGRSESGRGLNVYSCVYENESHILIRL